jgi:DUF3073 family protein
MPGIVGPTTKLVRDRAIPEVIPANTCEGVDPMGRGRAKAKQTKVARELKYREFNTDFTELQRELHGDGGPDVSKDTPRDPVPEDDDPYADVYGESAPRR